MCVGGGGGVKRSAGEAPLESDPESANAQLVNLKFSASENAL